MADREKVIRGLGCLAGEYDMESNKCAGCGYLECATFALCICEIARDAIELLKAGEPGWISVDKALPEEGDNVLVYCAESGEITTDCWWCDEWHMLGEEVTHWMPLPEPPKGDEV